MFEIRDFKLDETKLGYGVTYKGRGTLIAKSGPAATGSHMVFLTAVSSRESSERTDIMVRIVDGIGTIETLDFLSVNVG